MLPRYIPGPEQIRYLPLESTILGMRYAWRGWISSISWQRFGTFTFDGALSAPSRDKLFKAMINEGNRHLFGRSSARWVDGGMTWVRVEEKTLAGQIHLHALIRYSGAAIRPGAAMRNMENWWQSRCGHCRIERIRHGAAVCRYLTKYIKDGAEIAISQNFPAATFLGSSTRTFS